MSLRKTVFPSFGISGQWRRASLRGSRVERSPAMFALSRFTGKIF
jgi:hypothetical protein